MRHPLRGFLIGPLAVPLAYWLGGLVYVGLRPDLHLDGSQALRELLSIIGFGLPVAYLAALVLGLPALYLLRRLGWLRAWIVIVAGALAGTIVALCVAASQQGSLFLVRLPVPAGAALGALAGAVWWWAGQGRAERHDASDRPR